MDLEALPRVEIGKWPTPIRRLDHVSEALGTEVWIKNEEECGAWGGNKVRKLEHIFHELRAARVIKFVTWGAGTSNWTAAAAWHGTRVGFEVVVGLGGPVPGTYARLYADADVRVLRLPRIGLAPVAAAGACAAAGPRARLLPVGGSGGVGDIGSTRAGLEIAQAIASGAMPVPRSVVVPTGTCGTTAGVAVGLGWGRSRPVVMAVKVADWPYGTRSMIERRVRHITRRLKTRGIEVPPPAPISHERDFLGRGYGHPTPESRAAIAVARHDGLELDGTYAAKAFAALLAAARRARGPYLFVHTSPGPTPRP